MKLKLRKLYFDNGLGDVIDFTSKELLYQDNDLMKQSWSYNKTQFANGATEITDFYKSDKSYSLTVHLWDVKSETAYREVIDRLTAAADKNILTGTFGKLYLNDDYLLCRITGIEHMDWRKRRFEHKIKLTLTADYPMWIHEQDILLTTASSSGGKLYPLSYPYSYGARATVNAIRNSHYSDSDFKITFYGYAEEPSLNIGGVVYGFSDLILTSSEYAVYDTFNRQMYKMSDSVKTDLFNSRMTRSGAAYTPLKPGDNPLTWSRSFTAKVTIYQERSLPSWV